MPLTSNIESTHAECFHTWWLVRVCVLVVYLGHRWTAFSAGDIFDLCGLDTNVWPCIQLPPHFSLACSCSFKSSGHISDREEPSCFLTVLTHNRTVYFLWSTDPWALCQQYLQGPVCRKKKTETRDLFLNQWRKVYWTLLQHHSALNRDSSHRTSHLQL